MLTTFIERALLAAWERVIPGTAPESVEVRPSDRVEFGDYSTNLALVEGKARGRNPRELALLLVDWLRDGEAFERVEVAGPGFVNVFLRPSLIHEALARILRASPSAALASDGNGMKVQIEFVSSNPTGPLTVGHGRQAVLGDALASLYEALGYDVSREYYFNDEGRQIDLLARSLWVRYREGFGDSVEIPEDGYRGDYLVDLGRELRDEMGDAHPVFDEEAAGFFREIAVSRMTALIKAELAELGVRFDTWFSEATLHRRGEVDAALRTLRARGGTHERDGAEWLRAEAHGGTKDAVLIRGDGRPTYLMVDIAYHIDKHRRGFERVINVQGADHQAEQSCMKAAMRILGYDEDFLDYAVHQFVTIREAGDTTRMSTRAGRFLRLADLTQELGPDVVRYFMVARKPESHLEFDLELARAESLDNPVYYIQYANTRIASIFRKANRASETDVSFSRFTPLAAREELDLIKALDRFPDVVREAAHRFAPHLVAEYALELARAFHAYYGEYRVIGETEDVTVARLHLLQALRSVFERCLGMLGMSVPQEM